MAAAPTGGSGTAKLTPRGESVGTAVGQSGATVSDGAVIEASPEVALAFALLDVGGWTDEGNSSSRSRPAWMRILEDLESDPIALYLHAAG